MPDWEELLDHELDKLKFPRVEKQEVIAELASHFEDCECHAMLETNDLNRSYRRRLSHAIERAKREEDPMNHRTRSLWLPALATFFCASVSLTLCQFSGLQPSLVRVGKNAMSFYWPWFATLPLFGAAGAHLSQRARGTTASRAAATLSPTLVMLIVMLFILPWGLMIDGLHFLRLISFRLGLINWVVIPALALSLGGLPFMISSTVREA